MKAMHLFVIGTFIGVMAFIAIQANSAPLAPAVEPTPEYPILLWAEPAQSAAQPAQENSAAPQSEDPAGAVFNGFNVEMTAWYVCVAETKVYSNPGENPDWYLYTLTEGAPVIVRELDLGTRTFAAIQVGNYTKFSNLCPAED